MRFTHDVIQNRKYVIYRNAASGGPSHPPMAMGNMHSDEVGEDCTGRLKTQVRKTKVPGDGICKYGKRKYESATVENVST